MGALASQPSLLPPTNRTIEPSSATKMSPSMYVEVIFDDVRAVASQAVGLAGKPLPSAAGE